MAEDKDKGQEYSDHLVEWAKSRLTPEQFEDIESASRQIGVALLQLAGRVAGERGNTGAVVSAVHEFSNSLYSGTSSANHYEPEKALVALNGARALLDPEPVRDNEENAQKIVDELKERYSLK